MGTLLITSSCVYVIPTIGRDLGYGFSAALLKSKNRVYPSRWSVRDDKPSHGTNPSLLRAFGTTDSGDPARTAEEARAA